MDARRLVFLAATLACTPAPPEKPVEPPSAEPPPAAPTEPPSVEEAPPEPAVDPGPPAKLYSPIPEGHEPLVGVSQAPLLLFDVPFDFHDVRPQLYVDDGMDCAVIDLPTGRNVGYAPLGSPDCARWKHPHFPKRDLEVDSVGGTLEIISISGRLRRSLACGGCAYETYSWEPGDRRIAALSLNPLRLDIWDVDAGTRLEQHPLEVSDKLFDVRMAWNDRSLVVLLEHGKRTHDISVAYLPNGGTLQKRSRVLRNKTVIDTDIDSSLRWALDFERRPKPGGGFRGRLSTIPLTDQRSGLDWTWSDEFDPENYDDSVFESDLVKGRWRADATTQWLETRIHEVKTGSRVSFTMEWRAIVAEPTPSVHGREVHRAKGVHEDRAVQHFIPLGMLGDEEFVYWEAEMHNEHSRGSRLGLGWCVPLDASPQLNYALADCSYSGLSIVRLDASDHGGPSEVMQIKNGRYDEFAWGSSGWLAIRDGLGKLTIIDLETRTIRHERGFVEHIGQLALGSNQDRIAVLLKDRWQLLDGNGTTLLDLPIFLGRAGLHPDGTRLAVIIDNLAQVIEIDSGEVLASWAEPHDTDIAWRQDGAALLVGNTKPKKVVDPTGKLLATLNEGDWTKIRAEGLDPSWRWAQLPDGRILRTIDGMTLTFGPTWARIDCGIYEATPGGKAEAARNMLYRVGGDPFEVPTLEPSAVERWSTREGVLAAFFAGEAISPPSAPTAAQP